MLSSWNSVLGRVDISRGTASRQGVFYTALHHNLAINALRDGGHHTMAAGLRHTCYEPFTRPLNLLDITRPATLTRSRNFAATLALSAWEHSGTAP